MNTSAPICITSYIKGNNPQNQQRPGTKGNPRRQASFNQTGGFQNKRQGQANDLGIVSG